MCLAASGCGWRGLLVWDVNSTLISLTSTTPRLSSHFQVITYNVMHLANIISYEVSFSPPLDSPTRFLSLLYHISGMYTVEPLLDMDCFLCLIRL